jgi:hypothetical protein
MRNSTLKDASEKRILRLIEALGTPVDVSQPSKLKPSRTPA